MENPFFEQEMLSHILNQKAQAPTVKKLLKNLGKAGTSENPATCTAKITFATHPIMRKSPYAGMYFNGQGRPIDVDGYANTLPASMGGGTRLLLSMKNTCMETQVLIGSWLTTKDLWMAQ